MSWPWHEMAEFWIIAVLAGLVEVWIYALMNVLRVSDASLYRSGSKMTWMLVIVVLGILGAFIYLLAGAPKDETGQVRPADVVG